MLPPIAPPDAPAQPGWWPLPPGWWLLGLALFVLLMWGMSLLSRRGIAAWGWRRRTPPPATRQLALAALDELGGRLPASDREVAYRLNEILRAALFDVAAEATEWRPFPPVADISVERDEWHAFWVALEMRYRRPDEGCDAERQQQWLALARGWIEQLPEFPEAAEQP